MARVTLFRRFSKPVFYMFSGPSFSHFGPQRVPKGYPLETISGHFGGTGGNVKTVVSPRRNHYFHGWRGSPKTPKAFRKARRKNHLKKHRQKHKNRRKWLPKGTPLGDQKVTKNRLFRNFFDLAPSGVPSEAPGSPNDPPRVPK